MNFYLAIATLVLPVVITGTLALFIKLKQSVFKLVLAFSAAYLFSTTIMHLLPEVYQHKASALTGLFIVIGFCIQLLIERISSGLEHGHHHHHSEECKSHFPYAVIVGLLLHSFIEGMPVFQLTENGGVVDYAIVFGLVVHNIPISFLFVALLKEHQVKVYSIIAYLIVFSFMAPVGMLANNLIHTLGGTQVNQYHYIAGAIVTGIFLYISTAILFETGNEHKYSWPKILALVSGVLFAYFLVHE